MIGKFIRQGNEDIFESMGETADFNTAVSIAFLSMFTLFTNTRRSVRRMKTLKYLIINILLKNLFQQTELNRTEY
jgi:hypothetical protein